MQLSGKQRMQHAHNGLNYAHCFWGIDSMLYSVDFANNQLNEAERTLRQVGAEIIAESCGPN